MTEYDTPNRFQDFEINKNVNFHQITGKLYRWAEDTAFTEAQLVIEGTMDNINVKQNGEVVFDLIDIMHKYDVKMPFQQITSEGA